MCPSSVRYSYLRITPQICTDTQHFASQQFTAQRKRSWAQTVLGGRPSPVGYEDLFDSGTYRDLSAAEHGSQKLLSCVEESETEILNNTCVLGMLSFTSGFLFGWNFSD